MDEENEVGPDKPVAPPVAGKKKAGRPKKDKTVKDQEKEEADDKEIHRRNLIAKWLSDNGYPTHDEDMLSALIQFVEAKDKFNRSVGRPSKYDPLLCGWVEWLGARGYSIKQIAAVFDVSVETMYAWGRDYSEFSESVARARDLSQAWWETVGQAGMFTKSFNFQVWNKLISNRFRQDYTDRKGLPYDPKEPEIIVEEGDVLTLDPRDLTAEQRKVLSIALGEAKPKETK